MMSWTEALVARRTSAPKGREWHAVIQGGRGATPLLTASVPDLDPIELDRMGIRRLRRFTQIKDKSFVLEASDHPRRRVYG